MTLAEEFAIIHHKPLNPLRGCFLIGEGCGLVAALLQQVEKGRHLAFASLSLFILCVCK